MVEKMIENQSVVNQHKLYQYLHLIELKGDMKYAVELSS